MMLCPQLHRHVMPPIYLLCFYCMFALYLLCVCFVFAATGDTDRQDTCCHAHHHTQGLAPAAVLDRVQDRLPTLLVGGSLYWPVVNVANFALLSPSQRVLGVSACSLVWNAYMSFVTAGDGSSGSSSSK